MSPRRRGGCATTRRKEKGDEEGPPQGRLRDKNEGKGPRARKQGRGVLGNYQLARNELRRGAASLAIASLFYFLAFSIIIIYLSFFDLVSVWRRHTSIEFSNWPNIGCQANALTEYWGVVGHID